jgi:putative acetyltransferase
VVTIRAERAGDEAQVREVNQLAFGQPVEADLVDRLRRISEEAVSLVAVDDRAVVGHILFTPVEVDSNPRPIRGMGLAPMAVHPERQRDGIGSELVRQGLKLLGERGIPFVVVVGHPEYYPRFGFVPASSHGLRSQWDEVPDEAFMVLVLDAEAMRGVSGIAKYGPEFDL